MSYPEAGATYKHKPKFVERMRAEEKADGGAVDITFKAGQDAMAGQGGANTGSALPSTGGSGAGTLAAADAPKKVEAPPPPSPVASSGPADHE